MQLSDKQLFNIDSILISNLNFYKADIKNKDNIYTTKKIYKINENNINITNELLDLPEKNNLIDNFLYHCKEFNMHCKISYYENYLIIENTYTKTC